MSVRLIGLLNSLLGLAVVITSALVLYDAVKYQNDEWERQYSPYVRVGYDVRWDTLKYDYDILIIITPLSLLVGLLQMVLPLFVCFMESKDRRKIMQIWIGVYSIIAFLILAFFIMGMIYRVDQMGIKRYEYSGRYSQTYLSTWWSYDKGQAYLGVMGCDVAVLLFAIAWMAKWMMNPHNAAASVPSSRSSNYSYDYEYNRGTGGTAV